MNRKSLLYAVRRTILQRWWLYALVFVFIAIEDVSLVENAALSVKTGGSVPDTVNFLLAWFQGEDVIRPGDVQQPQVPLGWLYYYVGILIVNGGRISAEFRRHGCQTLVRTGKRTLWWMRELCLVFFSVIVYQSIFFLLLLTANLAGGKISLAVGSGLWIHMQVRNGIPVLLLGIIGPLFVSCSKLKFLPPANRWRINPGKFHNSCFERAVFCGMLFSCCS